ncbi:M48 family metalloprotease [Micromonospora okii]|uniref:M48 family metalloprotease n=1 Tax=Micromonospora okii TaxID=1182970 RepID=UPI001E380D31|nr:M48 family metalloprotease [Micromonospora okii]
MTGSAGAAGGMLRGRAADTGFLLLPLAVLTASTAVLLAVVFGMTVLVPPGCGLDVFAYPCTSVFLRMSNFFNLLVVPGAMLFLWQARLHRRRTRPLEPGVFAAAEPVIDRVLASAALPRPVPVVLGPGLGRRAFTGGTGARPYVACGPELLALPGKGEEGRRVFEAVLRHELAHVQNHDLLRHHSATALRISARTAALLTGLLLAAELAWAQPPPGAGTVAGVLVRAGLLAVAAELVVRAFFRAREHQADLRAAGGDPAGIRAALHGGRERPRGLRERLLSRHPTTAARLAEIDGGVTVLAFPLGQVLAGGVFAAVGLDNVQLLLSLLMRGGVLELPRPDAVSWPSLLAQFVVVGLPVAAFLALGVSRDARGRRLTGRPARPWRVGLVFAAGLVAGLFLAPYGPLLYGPPAAYLPVLTSVAVCAVGAVALCHWAAAATRPGSPAAPPSRAHLAVVLPVAAGALVLLCQILLATIENGFDCRYRAGCGPWGFVRVAVAGFSPLWAVVVLTLATVVLLVVTLRRVRPTVAALRPAVAATAAGAVLAAALPPMPWADALAVDWGVLGPRWDAPAALVLQVTLLTAVAVAATTGRDLAGPVAAGAALVVAGVGLVSRLADAAGGPVPLRAQDVADHAGILLGGVPALSLVAVVAALGARALLARARTDRPARAPVPGPRAAPPEAAGGGQPVGGRATGE